ncbi:MAG: ANR family transcriptional regulator [Aeromonas veronii]
MSIQDIRFNGENPFGFKAYALQAVELESKGLWDEARDMWGTARKVARKPENVLWAQTRADYCLQAKHRHWRPGALA